MGERHKAFAGQLLQEMSASALLSVSTLLLGSLIAPVFAQMLPAAAPAPAPMRTADLGTPPLPVANPQRTPRAAIPEQAAQPIAEPPPMPSQNPLRGMRAANSEGRITQTGHVLPAAPRTEEVRDSVVALGPLLNYAISPGDLDRLRESIELVGKRRFGEAAERRSQISDPTARKIAEWYFLRNVGEHPDPFHVDRFRSNNPDWPSGGLLRRNAELSLLKLDADPHNVTAFYDKTAPTTGLGRYLLALASKRRGQDAAAALLAREAWHSEAFSANVESEFLAAFGGVLTPADHLRRANYFLYKDRRQLLPNVQRLLKYLDPADQAKLSLRMDVVNRRLSAAEKQFEKMGPEALQDPGLLFSRIQMLRRKKQYAAAWDLLARAPQDARSMIATNAWWIERRSQARLALAEGKPSIALAIVARHGEIAGSDLVEAEFLAGWIALSKLRKPQVAEQHFVTMRAAASDPQDLAKAEYWLGRSKLARKDSIGALSHFSLASKYQHYYYGQLALQRMEQAGLALSDRSSPPTAEETERFLARDSVRALIISHKAQLDGITPQFFSQLAWRLSSPGEMTLLAELASHIHSAHGSVITGKIGIHRGFALDRYAYPINALPAYDRLTDEVEKSLILALARQESEFNPAAHSPAGAHGMMQIMPGTAKLIARQHKVVYDRGRLTRDPAYNVALGVAHLHDLLQSYNGSYVLTLVAYNAGPGRAREWIADFGDPRSHNVDVIDWVENIPFAETRRYVQRILASMQIFRHRLHKGRSNVRLVQDLKRGQPDPVRKASLDGLDNLIAKVTADD